MITAKSASPGDMLQYRNSGSYTYLALVISSLSEEKNQLCIMLYLYKDHGRGVVVTLKKNLTPPA